MRVFACMASSLDGKIGPANVHSFVPIGSRADMDHLISLRDEADGILFGASTFRAWPKVHRGKHGDRSSHHFIMSRSLNLDFQADLFQHPEIPVTIFSGPAKMIDDQGLPPQVAIVSLPEQAGQIEFILQQVADRGVKSLLIEGGGHVLYQFVEAQVLEELYLTLVPRVIGDSSAPALLGAQPLSHPPEIKILDSRQIGHETFLHLQLNY